MKPFLVGLTSFVCVILSTSVFAATSEGYGMGGWMYKFQPVIDEANRTGELFRIKGHCQSACTSFLGIRNVCIERSATLLFHAGHDDKRQISAYWTERILSAYKPSLRQYLLNGHYMETLSFHAVSGAAMIDKFGYKQCPRG
jgi:hypothetical protein